MPVYEVTFKIVDELGTPVTRTLLGDFADEAALLTGAAAMAAAYQGITKSAIEEYSYKRTVSFGGTAAAGSNVDAGMRVKWATGLPTAPVTRVPDPIEALKLPGRAVDTANVDFVAWSDLFTSGAWRVNSTLPTQPTGILAATIDV